MNWSAEEIDDVPPSVVTVMSTVPATPEGEITVSWVALLNVTLEALTAPKATVDAAVKLAPLTTTEVPPLAKPIEVPRLVTVGNAK